MERGRRTRAILLAGMTFAAIVGASAVSAAAEEQAPPISLAVGQAAFWQGPLVDRARVGDPALCGVSGPCWSYELDLAAGSPRLRVAVGTMDPTNDYTVELIDPAGSLVASARTGSEISHHYAAEVFAPDPQAGGWTVRVIPENVVAGAFQARAKLEAKKKKARKQASVSAAAPSAAGGPLLPNLQVNPPWEVGFRPPLPAIPPGPIHLSSIFNELGIHDADAALGGLNPSSCTYDETLESSLDTHCLRFSTGIPNYGAGPFTIKGVMDISDPEGDGVLNGPLTQRIYNPDGTHTDVPAGSYEFHNVHFHFHVTNLAEFRLFRVEGDSLSPRGSLTEVGKGLKEGFCLVNVKMATFTEFIQGVPNPEGDCLPHEGDGSLEFVEEITQGWEDVYNWETPGQYIDFEGNPDGLYVIQMRINTEGQFRESRLDDNTGYTYVRISGDDVQVLERGRGSSPFDPQKTVLDPVFSW
jgi:hypothetical protein